MMIRCAAVDAGEAIAVEPITADPRNVLKAPSPWDGCKRLSACAAGLACTAFALYITGASEPRWRTATRVDADTAKIVAIFGNDDGEMTEAA
jgi:hypothetical protein